MNQQPFIVDGAKFLTLEEAGAEFNRAFDFEVPWDGCSLDGFSDILYQITIELNHGTVPVENAFTLIWRNSNLSKERLGYGETIKWYEERVENCHRANVSHMKEDLATARRSEGQTVFDMLVEIIRVQSHIDLRLE